MSNLQAPRSLASIFYLTLLAMYSVGNIYASKILQIMPHYAVHREQQMSELQNLQERSTCA